MKKILAGLGAALFIIASAILSTGAPIPLLTPASGCGEASQLLFCLNTLINQLNGSSGALISFGVGGTSSGGGIDGTTPNPNPGGGVLNAALGPGTSAGAGSSQTPVVLNAQRGVVTFLAGIGGVNSASSTSTAQANSSTLMVVNSFISSTSQCQATLTGVAAAGSSGGGSGNSAAPGVPFLASLTPTTGIWSGTTSQGVLLMTLGNAAGFAVTTQSFSISFWCQ